MATNTALAQAIWTVLGAIPPGKVASYGQLAEQAGLPGRARLAGRVLRELPAQTALPWHRVVRANGQIAFAPDSDRFREQTARLRAEGVTVASGTVCMREYRWAAQADSD